MMVVVMMVVVVVVEVAVHIGSGDGGGGDGDVDESSSWWLSLPRAATQETPGHCPKHLSTVVILIIIMFW